MLRYHWVDDCQGKKDYDGQIVWLSSRYWPASYSSDGRPSAKASILTACEETPVDGRVLFAAEFSAGTEAEVKQLVEAWADETIKRLLANLVGDASH